MLPFNFSCITNHLTKPSTKNNFSNQLCPDQFVAMLSYDANKKHWDWLTNYIYANQTGRININYGSVDLKNCILVVLESPHFDEYDAISHQAKGPAVGSTGKMFEKHFLSIINGKNNLIKLNQNLTYNIIFVNSVQYQASQGTKPLKPLARDRNWLSFWHQGFNADLCKRVSAYGCNTIVINMCTYGQNFLHNRVQSVLRCTYKKHGLNINNLYQSYHPSTWWIKRRRKIWK